MEAAILNERLFLKRLPSGSVSPKTRSKSGFSKTLFRKGLGKGLEKRPFKAYLGPI